MKYVAIALCGLALTGCGEEKKLVSVCQKAVQVFVSRADLVKFDAAEVVKSDIRQADAEALYALKDPAKSARPAMKRLIDIAYASGKDLPIQYWVDVRFRAVGINGGDETSASCHFLLGPSESSLLAGAVIAGRSYDRQDLLSLMVRNGSPNELLDYLF